MQAFQPTPLSIVGIISGVTAIAAGGFEALLVSVESWEPAGFGVSHAYYVALALIIACGIICGTWLSLHGFVEPLASPFRILWRSWPNQARKRVTVALLKNVLRLSVPTICGICSAFVALYLLSSSSTPLVAALLVSLGAWVLVVLGVCCSAFIGIWAGRSAMALLAAIIIGLMLPNGFANSVAEVAGIVLTCLVGVALVLSAIFTAAFWRWFTGTEK
ncbi:MAG: hypothetical protein Q4A71_07330 [Actinomycetaceae bacterium]|nr:hypothetical protein [Actinomycetaceae bacterium]